MKISNTWLPEFWLRSPIFSDLEPLIQEEGWSDWPDCDALNRLWCPRARLGSGKRACFYPQSSLPVDAAFYEEHIYATGEIPTREQNWHDFFNAMIWLQFPKTKSVLNAQHMSEIWELRTHKIRTRKRDAITLFDESGAIFVSASSSLLDALRAHEWKKVFWESRTNWWEHCAVFIFGHGLYEKILSPYIGMTANTIPVLMAADFFMCDRRSQIRWLDQYLSEQIATGRQLQTSMSLTPLPVLGVPGWWPDNDRECFYENQAYFRPLRGNRE